MESKDIKKKLITLYHGTSVDNVESILSEGLSRFWEGVYLTDSPESAARWTGFKLKVQGQDEIAVIEVQVDSTRLQPGMDHSPIMHEMFGVGESILHEGAVPADQITGVTYYQLKTKEA